jgi:hypothetical protein
MPFCRDMPFVAMRDHRSRPMDVRRGQKDSAGRNIFWKAAAIGHGYRSISQTALDQALQRLT